MALTGISQTARSGAQAALGQLIRDTEQVASRYQALEQQLATLTDDIFDVAGGLRSSAWDETTRAYLPIGRAVAAERLAAAVPQLEDSQRAARALIGELHAGTIHQQAIAARFDERMPQVQAAIDTVRGAARHAEAGTAPAEAAKAGERQWNRVLNQAADGLYDVGRGFNDDGASLAYVRMDLDSSLGAYYQAVRYAGDDPIRSWSETVARAR